MKRSDLILKLVKKHPSLTISECENIVDTVFTYMKEKLAAGHRIELRNFGVFSPKSKKSRIAINPKNRVKLVVPEKVVINLKLGKMLFKKLNTGS